jgi:hypothetical protein
VNPSFRLKHLKKQRKREASASPLLVVSGFFRRDVAVAGKQLTTEKKRNTPAISPKKKKTKTVEVKLQGATEEEKKARIMAAFSTPPEEALQNFRRASKEKRKEALRAKGKKTSTAEFLAKPLTKGKKYTLDLRVHTPGTVGYFLSGGIQPGPALVRLAKVKGLDLIGLTDFYDASMIDKIGAKPKGSSVSILPGIDFRCQLSGCSDVFLTALFPEQTTGSALASLLDRLEIPKSVRGKKSYVTEVSVATIVREVEREGGVIIPSRLDKTPYRQLAIKALVEDFGFRVFDLVHPESIEFFKERWPNGGFTFLSFSNAEALAQIGTRVATLKMASGDFSGLKELVQRKKG